MKPGFLEWATNANYAAGGDPWSGQPCKVPPAAGKIATGRVPSERPPASEFNWLISAVSAVLMQCSSERVLNWQAVDATAVVAMTGGPGEGHYDAVADIHDVLDNDGAASFEEANSLGGLIWADGVPPLGGPTSASHANDGAGNRAIVAVGGVYHSAARGAWAIPGPWGGIADFDFIRHDELGLWAVARDTSTAILGDIQVSTGIGVAFAAPPTPPGWAGGESIYAIEHSHHPAAKVYTEDPGNQVWVALTQAQCSYSADGLTWAAAAAHGMGSAPFSLAYSASGAKWITILANGDIGVSVDNGATWAVASPLASALGALIGARIASDGFGDWAIAMTDGAGTEIHVSWDNGATWWLVHLPTPPLVGHIKLWFGGGRWFLFTDDGAGALAAFTSLRAEEL